MTIVYTQNFLATSPGSLPSGWLSESGTWQVTTTDPVSGAQSLVASSDGDGNIVSCEAASAIADMDVRYDVESIDYFVSPMLRSDSAFQNGYVWVPSSNSNLSTFDVYKRVGGTFTQIGTIASGYSTPVGGGTKLSVRARIQGTTMSFKVWAYGSTEPSSWGGTFSDSTISAAGYFGFYNNVSSSGGSTVTNVVLDNLMAASDFAFSPSSQSTNAGSATGAYTVQPNGFPSTSTTIALSDGSIGGTFTPSSLTFGTTNNNPQTFTYTPSSGTGGDTITLTGTATGGFSSSHSVTCDVSSSIATDFTLTPSSLSTTPGLATGNYTVAPNGTPSSSATIVLSDNGANGTFTPSSLTFTTSAAQTFTYTPNASDPGETITLTATASGSFSTSHITDCIVTLGSKTLNVMNPAFFWSQGNWDHLTSGTFGVSTDTMQATAPGAYLKFNVSGTVNVVIGIDNSTNSGFPSGDMPTIRYSIDGTAFTDVQLGPSQTTLSLSGSLTTSSHAVEIYFKASSNTNSYGDVWGSSGVSPTNVLRINGITIDGGASVSGTTLLSKRMLIFGDSITAGEHANTSGSDDATQSFAPLLARSLGAEFAQLGYGGQGWTVVGNSNMAAFVDAWNLYSTGRSRSLSGQDYIAVVHGVNDARASVSSSIIQSDVEIWLASARSAAGPNTIILIIVASSGSYGSNLSAAVSGYKASSDDNKVYFVDATALLPVGAFSATFGGTTEWTYDGVHPLIFGHSRIGACYAATVQSAISAAASSGYSRGRVVNG